MVNDLTMPTPPILVFLGGFLIGFFVAFVMMYSFQIRAKTTQIYRAIGMERAAYHPKTGEIMFLDSTTGYILTGQK